LTLAWKSPGRNPSFSPASTAGRARTILLTRAARRASTDAVLGHQSHVGALAVGLGFHYQPRRRHRAGGDGVIRPLAGGLAVVAGDQVVYVGLGDRSFGAEPLEDLADHLGRPLDLGLSPDYPQDLPPRHHAYAEGVAYQPEVAVACPEKPEHLLLVLKVDHPLSRHFTPRKAF
jgi:hypothetical protein